MSELTSDTVPTESEKRSDAMSDTTSDTIPPTPNDPMAAPTSGTMAATTSETNSPAAGSGTGSILMGPGAVAEVTPTPARHRPFVVTILAIGVGLLAVLAGIHLLQSLGIIPFVIGRFDVRVFSLFYAIMWGLLVWVYVWLIKALWNVDPQAWIFLVVVSMFSMIFDFVLLVGDTTWSDVAASFLVSGILLLYCMLPSTRRTFDSH